MTPEQVESILRRDPGNHTGIGIKNVNDRLQIYFGRQYGLHITSEPDVGTTVEIRMPQIRRATMKRSKSILLCILLTLFCLCGCSSENTMPTQHSVVLIAKSTSTEFWLSVFAGAEAAARNTT